jgi:AbiV family abortive infection protein
MKALSIEEIESARAKLMRNAESLFVESRLLYGNRFFSRAYTLSHICCEELAKIPMLVGAGLDLANGDEVDWNKLYRRLTDHKEKINFMHALEYFRSEIRSDDSDYRHYEEDLKSTPRLNNMKNNSLYSGLVNDVFLEPAEMVSEEDAKNMISIAGERLAYFQAAEKHSAGKISNSKIGKDLRRLVKQLRS